MSRARIVCFFNGHILEHQIMPGYLRMPVRCRRCDYTEAGIEHPPMPLINPPAEPAFGRAQIITAKAGDTIVIMSKEILGADKRRLMAALVTASLPPGVKAIVLEGGMTLAHVEADPSVADGSSLAEKWERAARKQFECAERTDDPTGKRVMEHGATVYFNCASELKALNAKHEEQVRRMVHARLSDVGHGGS